MIKKWQLGYILLGAMAVIIPVVAFGKGNILGASDQMIGAFTGAWTPLSLSMVGSLWSRKVKQEDDEKEKLETIGKIKTLVAAELVNVSEGLIRTKELINTLKVTVDAQKNTITTDFSKDVPRPMPYTENLGSQITLLSQRQIDILTALRSGLVLSTAELSEQRDYGLWQIGRHLDYHINNDLINLAKAFEEFAPERQLQFGDEESVLASDFLRELGST